jgi:hypothetical protein
MILTVTPLSVPIGTPQTFTIQGGPPGAAIAWSSWLNQISTGETDSEYGQILDAAGNWQASGVVMPKAGAWEKVAHAYLPGASSPSATAKADYTVTTSGGAIPSASPAAPSAPPVATVPASSASNFFSGSLSLFGYSFPMPLVVGTIVVIGAIALTGGGHRR